MTLDRMTPAASAGDLASQQSSRPRPSTAFRARNAGRLAAIALAAFSTAIGACQKPEEKKLPPKSETLAELRVVRRGVHVTEEAQKERDPYPRERLTENETVRIEDGGLAWIRRDGGSTVLVQGPAVVTAKRDTLDVAQGSVFAESPQGIVTSVTTPEGPLLLSDVRASLEVKNGASNVYVLTGEVRTSGGDVAKAGELLTLDGKSAKVAPEAAWEDWTGGLATTDRSAAPAPFGIGTVGARLPGNQGAPREPLTIQRLDVRVTVDGDFATTEVDETFFNPISATVEGIYRFRAPEGANLERFGVDRMGGIAWGYVKEEKAAAAQYSSHVYQGSTEDPALLEWKAPGEYSARLYPIAPGATRRVVVRYSEWLGRSGAKGERRLYVYPMAAEGSDESLPHIEEFNAEIDLSNADAGEIRAGMEATRSESVVSVRKHDFVPRADLAIEMFDPIDQPSEKKEGAPKHLHTPGVVPIYRSPHKPDLAMLPPNEQADAKRTGAGEADYVLVPLAIADLPKPSGGLDVEIVVDSSAATDRASLSLARATAKSLLSHLGKGDRVAVFAGDDELRPVLDGADGFAPADDEHKGELLEALSRVRQGGATDLGRVLDGAISKLPQDRASAIVYIGDGVPTVGEMNLVDLRARLAKAPHPARIFALGVGEGANMALLDGIASGGFAEPVADEHAAALASLHVLEIAERSVDLGVNVDLGPNVERIYPRDTSAITEGETILVVGRVTGDKLPEEVVAKGSAGERRFKLAPATLDDHGDLRRRWAMGRLDQLMAEGAGQAALVDLGVRQGIITPVTSIYVPTTAEMTPAQKQAIDKDVGKLGRGDRATTIDETKPSRASGNHRSKSEEKEGGSGTRAKKADKSDEDQREQPAAELLDDAPAQTAAATASPASPPVAAAPAPAPQGAPPTGVWGRDDSLGHAEEGLMGPGGGGKGRGGDGNFAPPKAPEPTPSDGRADLEAKPSASAAPEESAASTPPAPPDVADNKNAKDQATKKQLEARLAEAEKHEETAKTGRLNPDTGVNGVKSGEYRPNVTVIFVVDDPGRWVRPCGEASKLPFGERMSLWRERLSASGGTPYGAKAIYEQALADCELPTARERAALLSLMLDFIPGTSDRVSLYRLMATDMGAADILYRGILARVTTPAQMRELSQALGLVTVEPSLLEKAIKDAKDPADLVVRLRGLYGQFPNDLNLALTLLDALEDATDAAAARGFAEELRARPDADAKVRTAVGELYLRLSARDGDAGDKARDAEEARRAFGEIVEFSPDDPVARRRLGDLFRAHGFYEDATRQYETLAQLTPDDPTVSLLLAASANGLGKLEEAVKWTEKGGSAGAPDASQGPFATARAFAATYLAWGKLDAKNAGDTKTLDALSARLTRVLSSAGQAPVKGQIRVVLTWSHPEFHPTLWSNALGAPMPAPEGDVTLGISQVMLPDRGGGYVEVRVEPQDLDRAARLGATATLTAVFDENGSSETIAKQEIRFTKGGSATLRFDVGGGKLAAGGGQ